MLHRISFRAMGCDILAFLEADSASVPAILDSVPGWFEEWEQALSRFRADSELSRLNQTYDQPIKVSDTLWNVFQDSLSANLMTNGLVTPTVLDAMLQAGYDRPFDSMPLDRSNGTEAIQVNPLSVVIWDEKQRTICLPKGVHLDFGGFAKGWAAHQAMERLKPFGPALVNAGGDIAVSGPREGGMAWSIGVSNPLETGADLEILLEIVYVKDGAVASSGKDRRHWMKNGVLQHHIINPRTGRPAVSDLLRATVIAPTLLEAEAVAKAVFILGSERGLKWIEKNPFLASVLILENGQVLHSNRMDDYL